MKATIFIKQSLAINYVQVKSMFHTFALNFISLTNQKNSMKKFTKVLPVLIVVAFLFSGCAKERNNYDKWLTASTWNLSTASSDTKSVRTQSSVPALGSDATYTDDSTTAVASGVTTTTMYTNDKPATGTETWDKSIYTSTTSMTAKFNTDGTVEISTSDKVTKYSHSTQSVVDPDFNITVDPTLNTMKGNWNWNNDVDTKQQISIDGLGTYEVTITNDKLTLVKNSSSSNQISGTLSGSAVVIKNTRTASATWDFAH
jgi:hypothetical protein